MNTKTPFPPDREPSLHAGQLSGQAEPAATKAYADEIWAKNPRISPNSWRIFEGCTVGKVGLDMAATGAAAAPESLKNIVLTQGVNVIDAGAAAAVQQACGVWLASLFGEEKLAREAVVVVARLAADLTQPVDDKHMTSQASAIAERLGLTTIDLLLLTPTPPPAGGTEAASLRHQTGKTAAYPLQNLENAFAGLEVAAKTGIIGAYGLADPALTLPPADPTHRDLATVLDTARTAAATAWGRRKRPAFRAIAVPFNLLELGALKYETSTAATFDGSEAVSALEFAARAHLAVLADRPLTVQTDMGHLSLALAAGADQDMADLGTRMGAMAALEEDINRALGGWPSVGGAHVWSFVAHGADLLAQAGDTRHFAHLRATVLAPQITLMADSLATLANQQPSDKQGKLAELSTRYQTLAPQLVEAMAAQVAARDADRLTPLIDALATRLPAGWQGAPLSQVALNAIASVPGMTAVLAPADVLSAADVQGVYEKGDFPDPAVVLGAG